MGLDMYAYRTLEKVNEDIDFQNDIDYDAAEQIMYWRKHPNLHGFMENLYIEKGGVDDFNCRPVRLTQEDIDRLAASIIDEGLPETRGFFFGESYGTEEERQEDLEFCKQASESIKEGYTVFYDSWW